MPRADGARNEDAEQHGDEAQRSDGHGHRGDIANDRRAGAEDESEQVRETRCDVRRRDSGEREDDEELRHLDRGEVFDRLSAHRAGTAAAAAARGKLLDELRPPDGVDRGLARREHGEDRDEQELQQEQLHDDRVH